MSNTTQSMGALRALYAETQKRQREADVSCASQFNVFRLVRRTEDELSHSAFLGSLLDPLGPHGQGNLFLRAFLQLLSEKKAALRVLAEKSDDGRWVVVREKATATGRLDIVIYSESAGVILAIENKINALEGNQQISRYREWINEWGRFRTPVLIYLTFEGDPSQSAKEDLKLSCRYDIYNWLDSLLPSVRASRIRDLLSQYLDSLPLENMPMTQNDELTKEMTKPENIEVAFEFADRVPRIKADLFDKLYEAIETKLKSRMKPGGKLTDYQVSRDTYGKKRAGLAVYPALTDDRRYAYWRLEKAAASGDGMLYYGVATNGLAKPLMAAPAYGQLVKQLEEQDFDATNRFWVLRKATEYDTRGVSFWKNLAERRAQIVNDLADQLWQLFESSREPVERLNKWASQNLAPL